MVQEQKKGVVKIAIAPVGYTFDMGTRPSMIKKEA